MRRATISAAGCALAALLAGCARGPAGSDAPEEGGPAVPVLLRAIETREFQETVAAPGQWRSSNEVVVRSPFAAYVESLWVRPGDAVAVRQPLGRLETQESRAALIGAERLLRDAPDSASRREAEAGLTLARRELSRVPLTAPAGGVVARRSTEPGMEVAAGDELLAILPPGNLLFEAHVPAAAAGRVRTGARARVTTADETAIEAAVQRKLPQASEADQTVLVWLSVSGGPKAPELGRFGTAEIALGPLRRVLAVPDSALVEDDLTGVTRIAVVGRDSVAVWQEARLGGGSGGWHELLSPRLPPGTPVVVRGQRGLPDSTRVHALP